MKKTKHFSAEYTAFLCTELRLIIKSGISLEEAFSIMADEETDNATAGVLRDISARLGAGDPLQEVLRDTGRFPEYMTDMVSVGYTTGYLEEVFAELADYYDRETRLRAAVRNAVAYPAVMLVMMLCVIVILIVKVMPTFESVFSQLGATMSAPARAFLAAGVFLGDHAAAAAAAVALIAAAAAALTVRSRRAGRLTVFMTGRLQRMAGSADLAAALFMTVASGFSLDEAVEMISRMKFDRATQASIEKIKISMHNGMTFAEAVQSAGVFSNIHNRMIAIGGISGSMDSVLREISEQLDRRVTDELSSLVGRIEPAIVIIMSVITGVILLSVMLPLMSIMNAIG